MLAPGRLGGQHEEIAGNPAVLIHIERMLITRQIHYLA